MTSAAPRSAIATCRAIFAGSHSSSESRNAMYVPSASAIPRFRASATPAAASLRTSRTRSPKCCSISAAVPSTDPSSMTIVSRLGYVCASTLSTARITSAARSRVGMITLTNGSGRGSGRGSGIAHSRQGHGGGEEHPDLQIGKILIYDTDDEIGKDRSGQSRGCKTHALLVRRACGAHRTHHRDRQRAECERESEWPELDQKLKIEVVHEPVLALLLDGHRRSSDSNTHRMLLDGVDGELPVYEPLGDRLVFGGFADHGDARQQVPLHAGLVRDECQRDENNRRAGGEAQPRRPFDQQEPADTGNGECQEGAARKRRHLEGAEEDQRRPEKQALRRRRRDPSGAGEKKPDSDQRPVRNLENRGVVRICHRADACMRAKQRKAVDQAALLQPRHPIQDTKRGEGDNVGERSEHACAQRAKRVVKSPAAPRRDDAE